MKSSLKFHDKRPFFVPQLSQLKHLMWSDKTDSIKLRGVPEKVWPGPRLNIKTVLSTYGDFHVKDKTAVRTSYL